ncbi:MAG: carboxyl-terminal processing protease, partial [Candidatus Latescibacterota bacterium]
TYARLSEARIDLSEYREALKIAIKANIAEQVYGTSAFEYILNQEDPMIQKVLEMEEALRSSK